MKRVIDLNCDLGEGFPHDAELLRLVTSANVSCGTHAGTPEEILATLRIAKENGVTVGAHPGYPDRANFGRLERKMTTAEAYALCLFQIGELSAMAQAAGAAIRYLKPHGAFYNQAHADAGIAEGIRLAAVEWKLPVLAMPGSVLESRMSIVREGFADRRYNADGRLVPRSEPNAFIEDPEEAVSQISRLIDETGVRSICVHGDNPKAVAFARAVRGHLQTQGFEIRAFV